MADRSTGREGGRFGLRVGTDADSDALAALHVASWRAAYTDQLSATYLASLDPERRAAGWRRWFRETPMKVWIAETDRELLGFCAAGPARDPDLDPTAVYQIYNLHIAPAAWRQGIGSALYDAAAESARADRFGQLTLWVVVTNARARAFYERKGLVPDGRIQNEPLEGGASLDEMRYRGPLPGTGPA